MTDRIRNAVSYLTEYMATYDRQDGYESYSEETFIDDVLYGLGVALDPEKYRSAQGYDEFKKVLREHLKEDE